MNTTIYGLKYLGPSINACADPEGGQGVRTFISLKEALGEYAYVGKTPNVGHLLMEMYHKCTHDTSKQRILTNFSKVNSFIRCIVATVAQLPDVRLVVHIGCPKSVISYWQEAGRCARDGQPGCSLILYDNFTAALKNTDKDMSQLVKNVGEKCFRVQIFNVFSVCAEKKVPTKSCDGCDGGICACDSCSCCSFCVKKCTCLTRASADIKTYMNQ